MSGSCRLEYTSAALEDLAAVYDYVAHELLVPTVARRQVERLRERIRGLASMPLRFPLVDFEPWASRGTRRMNVDRYAVFYIASERERVVTVVRALYAGRDAEAIAGEAERTE